MTNLYFLFACLVLGFLLQKTKTLPDNAAATMNGLIVNLFLPALTLRYAVGLKWDNNTLLPILSTWIVFAASYCFFTLLKKKYDWDKSTVGALIVVAGISSISFVGYPIFELLYGIEGLRIGIAMSQSGTFLVCSTVGIATVAMFATGENQQVNWQQISKDIFTFPPFVAFCIALIINFLQIKYNPVVEEILGKIGAPFSCIALVSIGFQMNFRIEKNNVSPLLFGLLFKLVLAPLLIFFLYFICFKQNNLGAKISVFGSMLGSMNTIGIIAIRKGLNQKLILQLLAMSIPLSLVFLFLVQFIIS